MTKRKSAKSLPILVSVWVFIF